MGACGAANEGCGEAPGEADEDEAEDVVDDGGFGVGGCDWLSHGDGVDGLVVGELTVCAARSIECDCE